MSDRREPSGEAPAVGGPLLRSLILETSTRAVFHTILLFSLFLLFAGHNAPGGGFIGGLVAGAAMVLHYTAHGPQALRRTVPVRPEALLGLGILFAAGTGVGALALGRDFLTGGYLFHADLGPLDTVVLHSAVVFDVGVYLIVGGLVLAVLNSLGAEQPGADGEAPEGAGR